MWKILVPTESSSEKGAKRCKKIYCTSSVSGDIQEKRKVEKQRGCVFLLSTVVHSFAFVRKEFLTACCWRKKLFWKHLKKFTDHWMTILLANFASKLVNFSGQNDFFFNTFGKTNINILQLWRKSIESLSAAQIMDQFYYCKRFQKKRHLMGHNFLRFFFR